MNKSVKIILSIIGVFLVLVVYKSITNIGPIPEKDKGPIMMMQFESNIEYEIVRSIGFGSLRTENFEIHSNYNEVCFQNEKVVAKGKQMDDYNIEIDILKVDDDFCLEPTDGIIKIKLEGLGNSTKVSSVQ